jgi:PAP2 superfamily
VEAGSLSRLGALRLRDAVRVLAPAVYLVVLAAVLWRDGIPAARERLLMWIVLGLLAFSITNVRGWARGVVLWWIPFALILWAYDLLRGHADGLLFETHVRPQLEADRLLGLGTAPTVWLQEHLWHGALDLRWWDYGAWAVYVSYFLATYLLAGWLWFFARDRFRRYVGAVSLLALMGFATYALFPAAPPWLASSLGELEPTTRTIGIVAAELPWLDFSTLFERGAQYANPVAAVPSLHAAYTLLVVVTLWPLVPRWVRPVLALYPPAMAFALVYTAEHYLVDVLLGWAYTLVAVWVVGVAAAWLGRRLERATSADPAG